MLKAEFIIYLWIYMNYSCICKNKEQEQEQWVIQKLVSNY